MYELVYSLALILLHPCVVHRDKGGQEGEVCSLLHKGLCYKSNTRQAPVLAISVVVKN